MKTIYSVGRFIRKTLAFLFCLWLFVSFFGMFGSLHPLAMILAVMVFSPVSYLILALYFFLAEGLEYKETKSE